jgi:hypothetical protein
LSLRQQGAAEADDERILGGGDFVQAVLEEADHRLTDHLSHVGRGYPFRETLLESNTNHTSLKSGIGPLTGFWNQRVSF